MLTTLRSSKEVGSSHSVEKEEVDNINKGPEVSRRMIGCVSDNTMK